MGANIPPALIPYLLAGVLVFTAGQWVKREVVDPVVHGAKVTACGFKKVFTGKGCNVDGQSDPSGQGTSSSVSEK